MTRHKNNRPVETREDVTVEDFDDVMRRYIEGSRSLEASQAALVEIERLSVPLFRTMGAYHRAREQVLRDCKSFLRKGKSRAKRGHGEEQVGV